MRVLYLIFSHDNLPQLARLVRRIRSLSPNCLIAIHHDPNGPKLDAELFREVPGCYLVPDPVRGEWGDYSLVQQYLCALSWCDAHLDFEWLITLTGLSYPIRPLEEFEAELAASGMDAFTYHFDVYDPSHWPMGTAETRYEFRYFKLPRLPYCYKVPDAVRKRLTGLRKWLNGAQPFVRIVPMPRGAPTRLGIRRLASPLPRGFALYGGRQILNVSRRALRLILTFLEAHPEWIQYARRTLIPDEIFFVSILANDRELRMANDTLRYIKWPNLHAASVGVIEVGDLPEVFASSAPFALKFNARVDSAALDEVDLRLEVASEAIGGGRENG